MQCRRNGCSNDVTGKAQYCCGSCRTKASRATVSPSVTNPTVSPQYVTVEGKCYNRLAVACREFGIRPAPLDPADCLVPGNRGRYERPDGTVYQFDATGHSFECKHPYTDRYGKPHLAVYETVADVRQAQGDTA